MSNALDFGITQVHKAESGSLRILESSRKEKSLPFWLWKETVVYHLEN